MDSDAKLNILTEALAAAGASALAIDARGDVAISTVNDAALERDVAAFVAERLDRIGDGALGNSWRTSIVKSKALCLQCFT